MQLKQGLDINLLVLAGTARDRLSQLLQQGVSQLLQQGGMQVQLTVTGQDRYQRPIAEARLTNGTLVQGVMVREGLATFQPQYIRSCPNAATELQSADAGQ